MTDRDRVNVLLYLLMRDEVPFGAIERTITVIENLHVTHTGKHMFANADRDAYIASLTDRLLLSPKKQKEFLKRFNRKVTG